MSLDISTKLAKCEREIESVYRLTHRTFVSAGLCHPQKDERIVHFPMLDRIPETFIIIAQLGGETVGTNTLTIDSPAGLHTDPNFKEETESIRSENRKLASSWRLAVDNRYSEYITVVNALIRSTFKLVFENEVNTTLFTFYEKHVKIYERLINAKSVSKKSYESEYYRNLPQVLMRWDIEDSPRRWRIQ